MSRPTDVAASFALVFLGLLLAAVLALARIVALVVYLVSSGAVP